MHLFGLMWINCVTVSDYEYRLDVSKQKELIENTVPLEDGLKESYLWYQKHQDKVKRKGYLEYIDKNFV